MRSARLIAFSVVCVWTGKTICKRPTQYFHCVFSEMKTQTAEKKRRLETPELTGFNTGCSHFEQIEQPPIFLKIQFIWFIATYSIPT